MEDKIFIETERLILRKFTIDDVDDFIKYRNDQDIAKYQSWETISKSEAIDFINDQKNLYLGLNGKWIQIAVELKSNNKLIGDCAVIINKDKYVIAEIGFTISKLFQGKGYAKESISKLIYYLFKELNVQIIKAIVDCRNINSIKLLENLNFIKDNTLTQNVLFKGEYIDEYIYFLNNDEILNLNEV